MKIVLHKANTRGHADHGWLNSYHTFSFAGYYDPERIHFGMLRVLNDDCIKGGTGFSTHPHDNMEIVSIPLEGALEHKDSMGNSSVIKTGEIQVMSAGTGIQHSEFNHLSKNETKFLQIWIFPQVKNVTPRYDQKKIEAADIKNQLSLILSPKGENNTVWIHQNAWFSMGEFENERSATYHLHDGSNGVYIFILEGNFKLNYTILNRRDGIGISGIEEFVIESLSENSKVLIMEIPMS